MDQRDVEEIHGIRVTIYRRRSVEIQRERRQGLRRNTVDPQSGEELRDRESSAIDRLRDRNPLRSIPRTIDRAGQRENSEYL